MKWLSLQIGGSKWSVYLVAPTSKHLEGGKYEGRCFFEKCRIYLSKEGSEDVIADRLLHELRHVLNRVNGVWEILENALGEKEAGRVEEALVSIETPHLHRLLKDLGFRFPKGIWS